MHIQYLSSPRYDLCSTIFSSSALSFIPPQHLDSCSMGPFNSNYKKGFCSFRKRVSESRTCSRSNGGLINIRCEDFKEKDDGFYVRRCVELAKKAIGCTSPNPMVGCVIVKDGEIVGEGFHPKAGQPHAEVFALRDAGDLANNATAYVSLEPCNHYGRTPPCTEALIQAKVNRVVIGMVDPNPIVASKGVEKLRQSGIHVTIGVEEELCKKLIEAYIHKMLTGMPFVTLRYSLTINGRILNLLGEGVTESGGYYSTLLQEYDAIILSSASLSEKSFPVSQEPGANQPLKIIIARNSNSLKQIPILTMEAKNRTIIFTDNAMVVDQKMAQQGIETVILDHINLNTVLDYCGRQGLCSVLLDLQGDLDEFEELLEEGLEKHLLQKVVMEVLPFWGGSEESGILRLKDLERRSLGLKNLESYISKDSVLVEGYFC